MVSGRIGHCGPNFVVGAPGVGTMSKGNGPAEAARTVIGL